MKPAAGIVLGFVTMSAAIGVVSLSAWLMTMFDLSRTNFAIGVIFAICTLLMTFGVAVLWTGR